MRILFSTALPYRAGRILCNRLEHPRRKGWVRPSPKDCDASADAGLCDCAAKAYKQANADLNEAWKKALASINLTKLRYVPVLTDSDGVHPQTVKYWEHRAGPIAGVAPVRFLAALERASRCKQLPSLKTVRHQHRCQRAAGPGRGRHALSDEAICRPEALQASRRSVDRAPKGREVIRQAQKARWRAFRERRAEPAGRSSSSGIVPFTSKSLATDDLLLRILGKNGR
jgi:uncharacterized protein YecT (DUF1311 family)